MAHRQHRVDQVEREGSRHRPEVLRRAAEAGESDQGNPLVHRAKGRCDRVLARRGDWLGDRARRSKEREDSRRADGPRDQQQGRLALCHVHRLGLHRGRPQGGPLARREGERQSGADQYRRIAGNGGLRARDRSQEGLRGNHQIRSEVQDHSLADRRLHAREGQGSDGGISQGRRQEDQRALRTQRRHGDRRDSGDRGSGHEAGQGHHHHFRRWREGRVRSDDGGQAQRIRGMQPAARAAADVRGEGHQGGQVGAQADRYAGSRRRNSPTANTDRR